MTPIFNKVNNPMSVIGIFTNQIWVKHKKYNAGL